MAALEGAEEQCVEVDGAGVASAEPAEVARPPCRFVSGAFCAKTVSVAARTSSGAHPLGEPYVLTGSGVGLAADPPGRGGAVYDKPGAPAGGTMFRPAPTAVSAYRIVLKRNKGHKSGYYVYTAFPI